MVTQEKLKELFSYNPDTGLFTRLVSVSQNTNVGDVAGWKTNGYIYTHIKKKNYLIHRLAWLYMTGGWPKNDIDHVNHIRNDNRWVNLREATRQENLRNASISKANKSKTTGVSWDKEKKKWRVEVMINGRQKNIGRFIDKFEAICCRKSAENKYNYHKNHGM